MTPQHQIRTTTTPLTDVVGEGPFEAVEDEPAFLPGLDLASHLHQVALTHLLCEDDLVAGVHAVARRLDVGAQVELLLPYGQVAGHRAGLEPAEHGRLTVRTCLDFILQPDWFLMKLAVLIKRKVWKCFIFGILSMKRWTVLWWCSHTGLHSTLVWKWATVNVLNTPPPPPAAHVCKILPCLQQTGWIIFHFSTMQTQLSLILLTWEKFLALILTSFSTSCCRWKVSSCSLFSASSLLLLSSSSICRRAMLSRSWRRALSLNIFLICARASQPTAARTQLDIHTFMYVFPCWELLATVQLHQTHPLFKQKPFSYLENRSTLWTETQTDTSTHRPKSRNKIGMKAQKQACTLTLILTLRPWAYVFNVLSWENSGFTSVLFISSVFPSLLFFPYISCI